jgi:hypothetical protein
LTNPSKRDLRCLQFNAQANNVLVSALSEDVFDAIIIGIDKPLDDAHIIWTTLKERYDKSKYNKRSLSYGTSTSSSICGTNILREEEGCDRWRPNDKSSTPKGLTFYSTSHMCLTRIDSGSES